MRKKKREITEQDPLPPQPSLDQPRLGDPEVKDEVGGEEPLER